MLAWALFYYFRKTYVEGVQFDTNSSFYYGILINKQLLEANDKNQLVSCQLGIDQWLGKINPVWVSD